VQQAIVYEMQQRFRCINPQPGEPICDYISRFQDLWERAKSLPHQFYRTLRKVGPLENLAPSDVHPWTHFSVSKILRYSSITSDIGDGEIVGLFSNTNGRSCESHSVSGTHALPGDLVRFKCVIADLDGALQEAITCHRIRDGVESCRIGFLPRNLAARSKKKFDKKYGQILQSTTNEKTLQNRTKVIETWAWRHFACWNLFHL
jgi:hypothetical protein